jgi:hypothetical protein
MLGNHDVHSVVNFVRREGETGRAYARRTVRDHATFVPYVHPTALQYFAREPARTTLGAMNDRADALVAFYTCAPYMMLTLGTEVIFVHGGLLHVEGGERSVDLYERALDTQMALDAAPTAESRLRVLQNPRHVVSVDVEGSMDRSALWARGYALSNTRAVCSDEATVGLAEKGLGLVVVGHCVTDHGWEALQPNWDAQCSDRTTGQSQGGSAAGCVLMHVCTEPRVAVALVDTGLSECMYQSLDEGKSALARPTDVLYLCKDKRFGASEVEAFGRTRTYHYTRVRVGPTAAAPVPLNGRVASMVRRSLTPGGNFRPADSERRYVKPVPVAVTSEERARFHADRARYHLSQNNERRALRHMASALSRV